MCKLTMVAAAVIAVFVPVLVFAQVPRGIAGFVLGEKINVCQEELQMDTILPIRYRAYLKEVEIKPKAGFKSGLLTYEECQQPGRIVRIKMKYADSSRAFYQKLLKRFKARYGDDVEWRGDPFHIYLAWKWKFKDAKGNRISLILQHNIMDEEEKKGNSVKLTFYTAMEEAAACDQKKHPDNEQTAHKTVNAPVDWNVLMPQ